MAIKGVIFDFGGVVVNESNKYTYPALAKKFGVSNKRIGMAVEKALPDYERGRISNLEFCMRMAKALKISGKVEGCEHIWDDIYAKKSRINKHVQALIKKLKDSGYKLSVLSNTEPGRAKYNREHNRYKYFDFICLSSEIGIAKPDKRIYQLVLSRLKLKAAEGVFVDDKEKYVVAARKLGMHAIQYKNPKQLERDFKKLGIRLI